MPSSEGLETRTKIEVNDFSQEESKIDLKKTGKDNTFNLKV